MKSMTSVGPMETPTMLRKLLNQSSGENMKIEAVFVCYNHSFSLYWPHPFLLHQEMEDKIHSPHSLQKYIPVHLKLI